MRRRTLLIGAGSALVAAGCARTGTSMAGQGEASPSPTGSGSTGPSGSPGRPVATWRLVGGFLAPGTVAIRPYRLAVYANGLAVADATYQVMLSPADLQALIKGLVSRLSDGKAGQRRKGGPIVADAPATEIMVRDGDHTYVVTADAIEELPAGKVYPNELYQARALLDAVRQKAVNGGERYHSARVRLVASVTAGGGTGSGSAAPWPAGVPVPKIAGPAGVRILDLDGAQATRALAVFPLLTDALRVWPTYTTPSGDITQVAVRYLLPSE